jgi:general secretion pathway protein E
MTSNVVSRIKLMANMDITERRLAQDGHIANAMLRHQRDVRVGSGPTIYGERLVLRLMPDSRTLTRLDELGLEPDQIEQVRRCVTAPYGTILCVGPVGCGKSTTIYSCLELLNDPSRSVVTIEDPVERRIEGINQIQTDPRIDFTFVEALRGVLRQDPNVIMVGEIRDLESMQTAITVAETGHLVFATLHTNDAAQTVERIIDSFPPNQQRQVQAQLASALSGVISQRLLPWTAGGRIPAMEMMIATTAIRNVIREGNIHQILGIIQTSSDVGMQTLDASLQALVDAGAVRLQDAQPYFTMTKSLSR